MHRLGKTKAGEVFWHQLILREIDLKSGEAIEFAKSNRVRAVHIVDLLLEAIENTSKRNR